MDQPDPANGVWRATEPATPSAAAALADAARERQSHVRHELRAPLAVIYPLLSLLLDDGAGELTEQQREYLAVLDSNVVRLEALITGVAASGWADCSAAPPVPAQVVLGDVAEQLVALRAAEGARGAQVLVDAGDPPGPRAWADREDVRQILAGLVRNAVAYTPEGGTVTIRARAGEGGTVVLQVADTGPGIPPEELDRVFEFGFRGELARTLKVPGLGAGLWVCRELASRNDGRVLAHERAGRRRHGDGHAAGRRAGGGGADGIQGSRRDRLAADPARRRRPGPAHRALGAALRQRGYEVAVAQDAVAAMSAAVKLKPHVVVLDVGLPGGEGSVVMKRMHALPQLAGVPVVMMSGRDPEKYRDEALAAGASAYLTKPVDPGDLVLALRVALGEDVDVLDAAAGSPSGGRLGDILKSMGLYGRADRVGPGAAGRGRGDGRPAGARRQGRPARRRRRGPARRAGRAAPPAGASTWPWRPTRSPRSPRPSSSRRTWSCWTSGSPGATGSW